MKNYCPITKLISNQHSNTQTILGEIENSVFFEWWEHESIDRATLIFKVIEDYILALNRAGYTLVKIEDLNSFYRKYMKDDFQSSEGTAK